MDYEQSRQPFWDKLEEYVSKIPQPEPVYITGDCNVRFQANHPNDADVTGPYTYGKGRKFIDHSAESNRSLCVRTMNLLDMVEVASYKTPNSTHHITFRDKTAPPSDWSQYLLDPLIMQQFYDMLHHSMGQDSLAVASYIRAFLPMEVPLPPPKLSPSPDPYRFQRLDHTFTRRQWLATINSCKSKLHTGFPSDHYLLVTEVQIKLAKRQSSPSYVVKLDYNKVTQDSRALYNSLIASASTQREAANVAGRSSDHTAKIVFYTDGSGSKGKCSGITPAGWGWCYRQGEDWLTSHGPVYTDPSHFRFLGARVGSNNTGEVSAIIEALLYALEHEYTHVHIHSDSQWAINTITGKWRAKANKELVHTAKRLYKHSGVEVTLHWVKGHAGHEGNEMADRLAEQGKLSYESSGGRQIPLPPPRNASQPTPPQARTFADVMLKAASEAFSPLERRMHKPWLRPDTLRALAEARQASAEGDEAWKAKRNAAKRMARKDRVQWIHDQLLADPSADHSAVWKVVKRQKKGFQGKRAHLVVEGRPVPWSRTHEAFRDHLQNQQWKQPRISDHTANNRRARPPLRPQSRDETSFSLQDLQNVIQCLKSNKAPGPDGLVAELVCLLGEAGELQLLALMNECWREGSIPDSWNEATVVSIFKGKGSDTDPVNYRPISLLNVLYKIYAALLQRRLAATFDAHLRPNQFGFRAAKGTRHPLFILRRAMEWSTMTNTPLHLLFLDWKQAFDSLDHTAMLEALRRFGISDKMLAAVESIYLSPTFQTRGPAGQFAKGEVSAGIRQGCPLSPYLFVIVLTVILHDVDLELDIQGIARNTWSEGYPTYDLEYAHDTLLMAKTTPQMQSMLAAVESVASEYGMQLNQLKTEMLVKTDHPAPPVYFLNGSPVPRKEVVKYLGCVVAWHNPFDVSYKHRTALAEEAHKKLRLIWNSTLSRNTKLRIFQSIFIPVLIYGMDSMTLTTPQLHRLDAFYFRFLRRVVGIKASFYSRVSNLVVWETAGFPDRPSDFLWRSQYQFMREVYLASRKEPYHTVVFCSAHRDRILAQGRRRGMQFPYWLEVISKRYFPNLFHSDHTALGPILSMLKSPVHCRNLKVGRRQSACESAHGQSKTLVVLYTLAAFKVAFGSRGAGL